MGDIIYLADYRKPSPATDIYHDSDFEKFKNERKAADPDQSLLDIMIDWALRPDKEADNA